MPAKRPLFPAIKRGLRQRCPECGKGRIYRRYLKVVDRCECCGLELGAYRADDGPAYLTILLVGHLIIAPLLFFPFIWQRSPWLVLPVTLIPIVIATLLLLPRVKGGFLGVLWANNIKGDEHGPKAELAASEGAIER
ncbi:MAG TPA: DUF983 domain-containing protein [Caulobacteraceae bacterium]|jgi:uncharacterized protein (DUF983 family)